MELAYLLIGLIVGFAFGYLLFRMKSAPADDMVDRDSFQKLADEKNQLALAHGKAEERVKIISEENHSLQNQLQQERETALKLSNHLATSENIQKNLEQRLAEQKEEVEKLQQKFQTEFENIANRLLEQKSEKFTKQNQINLTEILNPLNEKIKSFEEKVERTHKETLEK